MNLLLLLVQVSAVTAVGLVEGTSHINWRVLNKILLWWIVGFCLVMLTTSLLVAQGDALLLCAYRIINHPQHPPCPFNRKTSATVANCVDEQHWEFATA